MPFQKGHTHWKKRKDVKVVIEKEIVPDAVVHVTADSVTVVKHPAPETMLQQIQTLRNTFNRHAIGMEKVLQDMQDSMLIPKCPKCYVLFGYTANCKCEKP